MKIKITFALLMYFLTSSVISQTFIKTLDYTKKGEYLTQPSLVHVNKNLNVVVGSISPDLTNPNLKTEIVVSAIDSQGNMQWSKRIQEHDRLFGLFASSVKYDKKSKEIVITGYQSFGNERNLIFIKMDLTGNLTDSVTYRLGAKLYGLDLVVHRDSYIISGLQSNTTNNAFVMSLDRRSLQQNWFKLYDSNIGGTTYDSFNHILKVENHPLGNDLLLLTGTATSLGGEPVVLNDLIDHNGNSVWSQPKAYFKLASDPNTVAVGKMALYDEKSTDFYIMAQFDAENDLSLIKLDFNGNYIANTYLHFHNFFLNGMQWYEKNKKIIISSYSIDGIHEPDYYGLQILDINTNQTSIYKLNNVIDVNYLKSINNDPITKVAESGPGYYEYEYFYTPKALSVFDSEIGLELISMSPYGVNYNYLHSINGFGDCLNNFNSSFGFSSMYVPNNNVTNQFVIAQEIKHLYEVENFEPYFENYCSSFEMERQSKSLDSKDKASIIDDEINIYPNPAKGEIFINNLEGYNNLSSVKLFNVTGQEVLNVSLNDNTNRQKINIDHLSPGIYFLQVIADSKSSIFNHKIIKQ